MVIKSIPIVVLSGFLAGAAPAAQESSSGAQDQAGQAEAQPEESNQSSNVDGAASEPNESAEGESAEGESAEGESAEGESAEGESDAPAPETAEPWEGITVSSTHEPLDIAGKPYLWLRPGTPLNATIEQKGSLGLNILLVRLHQTKKEEEEGVSELPPGELQLTIDEETKTEAVLAPVEVELESENHPLLMVSYPVAIERQLAQKQTKVVLSVSKENMADGIAVLLEQSALADALPTLSLSEETPANDEESTDSPSPEEGDDNAEDTQEPVAEENEVEQPTDGLIPAKPPDEDKVTAMLTTRSLNTGIPLRFHFQFALPGELQPYGGLYPLAQSGGARFLVGYGEGLMSNFLVGVGLDLERQSATSSVNNVPLTWTTADARMRLEGSARVLTIDAGFTAFELGVVGGAGLILGTHAVTVNEKTSTLLLWGPTFRLGLEAGVAVGPGALTLTLPVDQSVGISSKVKNYHPLAASMSVGYRLEL